MCKQDRRYIRIIHENTTKSRQIAEELSRGIEEEGALYLIEEETIKDVQIEVNSNNDENKVSISIGIRDKEICVYYQQSEDIPLLIYDIGEEEENKDDFELKTIGKNVAQLIVLKPFINLLTTE